LRALLPLRTGNTLQALCSLRSRRTLWTGVPLRARLFPASRQRERHADDSSHDNLFHFDPLPPTSPETHTSALKRRRDSLATEIRLVRWSFLLNNRFSHLTQIAFLSNSIRTCDAPRRASELGLCKAGKAN
jgi:hypothetical protein